MKPVTDFLSLRPIWTRRGLELVWWAHVVSAVLQVAWMFQFMAWPGAVVGLSTLGMAIDRSLSTLLYLVMVRVVLELALKYLVAGRQTAESDAARMPKGF